MYHLLSWMLKCIREVGRIQSLVYYSSRRAVCREEQAQISRVVGTICYIFSTVCVYVQNSTHDERKQLSPSKAEKIPLMSQTLANFRATRAQLRVCSMRAFGVLAATTVVLVNCRRRRRLRRWNKAYLL